MGMQLPNGPPGMDVEGPPYPVVVKEKKEDKKEKDD